MTEVEQFIRDGHLINKALQVLKMTIGNIRQNEKELLVYLNQVYEQLNAAKDELKPRFKQVKLETLTPDRDLLDVFNEAELLAKSSFPHRAIGFISAIYPKSISYKELSKFVAGDTLNDIQYSHQMFSAVLSNGD